MLSYPIRVRAIYKHITYHSFQFRALTLPPNSKASPSSIPISISIAHFQIPLTSRTVRELHSLSRKFNVCVHQKILKLFRSRVSKEREKNKPTEMPVNLNKNEQNVATWKLITVAVVASHLREPPFTPPSACGGAELRHCLREFI